MEQFCQTDHVMIYQHDHVIEKEIDFCAVVATMRKFQESINYMTFMHKNYMNIVSKYAGLPLLKGYLVKLLGKDQS
jgi:hypothetical protein